MKNHIITKSLSLFVAVLAVLSACQTKNVGKKETQSSKIKKDKATGDQSNVIVINRYENADAKNPQSTEPNAFQTQSEEDTTEKVVDPALIEKYRRARNVEVYVDVYPIDWAGINRDRGIKEPRERRQRQRTPRSNRWVSPWFWGNNFGIWPNTGIGWNQNSGFFPYANIGIGSPFMFGPNANIGWNGNNGWNTGVNMGMMNFYNPLMFQNPWVFQNPNMWNNQPMYYNHRPNNRRYNQGFQQGYMTAQMQAQQQQQMNQNQQQQSQKVENTPLKEEPKPAKEPNPYDYSDGVGGPERYKRNIKRIEDYKVE